MTGLALVTFAAWTAVACTEGISLTDPDAPDPGAPSTASVQVTPESPSIDVGGTVQLTATVEDSAGNALERSATWTSLDEAVATVDDSGLVTGQAEGTAGIVATADGVADTASVEVLGSGNGGSGNRTADCSDPDSAWIWCDDFEQDRLGSYFEYNDAGGAFTRVAGVGRDGSVGMRTQFQQGDVGVGWLHLAFGRTPSSYFDPVDAGTADYREIYWRVYVRNEADWSGGGGSKLSRATVFANSNWAQAMIGHVWSGADDPYRNYLYIDPASGTDAQGNLQTTGYNDFANLRWLGARQGDTPLFDDAHVGSWYCVEAHVRLNDPGSANGVFELWIDGQKDAERTGLNWVGDYQNYGINAVFLENHWNAGSPKAQERYFDDFVVSTERIGC